jgi:hypothetical protein
MGEFPYWILSVEENPRLRLPDRSQEDYVEFKAH